MRRSSLSLIGLLTLFLLLIAPVAGAQGMGLDLSGSDAQDSAEGQETPGAEDQSGGIGLDLSSDVPSAGLRPNVVLLGLDTPERAGAAMSARWLKGLYTAARSNTQWALSSPPKEVREKLGSGYSAAVSCSQASCLAEPAETLDADLLVSARLALEDDGWTFRLWTYDRDRNKVETDSVTGRSPKDAKFQKAGADLLAQRLKGLAKPRAILAVKVNVPQAVVRLGERTLGVGSIERNVPPGEANLIVEADGFTSYNKPITLKPGEKSSVEAYIQLSGAAPEGPSEVVAEALPSKSSSSGAPAIFRRPALYTAVVGVLAMGAGVVMGMQAKKVADRAPDTDGDGIANITRKERVDLKSQANLSTALMAGGAAVAGGSIVWLAVMPTRSDAPKQVVPAATPSADSGTSPSTAIHFILGGSF